MRAASGDFLSRNIASVPSAGPGASAANAQRQPTRSTRAGINQIVATVNRKPIASWSVTAVPTYRWSATSVTIVENWAESATTQKPHTSPTASTTAGRVSISAPIVSAQTPEIAIDRIVVRVRPQQSPSTPPAQQPTPPAAITPNVANAAPRSGSGSPWAARTAA